MLEAADFGDERILRELDKFFDEEIPPSVRIRALELLVDMHGKRRTDINLHTDLVEIIPAPRPEDTPLDDA